MLNQYYYNQQLRNYIIAFTSIFSGMQVATGQGADGKVEMLPVPVHYGSIDRVVAAIQAANTQNKVLSLPTMSSYLIGIEMAPERRKGVGMTDRKTYVPAGGVLPDDARVIERYMPIPYNLTFELALYASNTDQAFQIIEQILMVFDPMLQIQTSDAPFDWTKVTQVELISMEQEENYPIGTEKRVIIWTFNFEMPVWISPPYDVRDEIVESIIYRLGDLSTFTMNEYDSSGNLTPFGGSSAWTTMTFPSGGNDNDGDNDGD